MLRLSANTLLQMEATFNLQLRSGGNIMAILSISLAVCVIIFSSSWTNTKCVAVTLNPACLKWS